MTACPVEFRHELCADTLSVSVLGNRSILTYFQESRRAFGLAYASWYHAGFTARPVQLRCRRRAKARL